MGLEIAEDFDRTLGVSPFQQRVLGTPEGCDLFLGGGRGGGKSWAVALLILRTDGMYLTGSALVLMSALLTQCGSGSPGTSAPPVSGAGS